MAAWEEIKTLSRTTLLSFFFFAGFSSVIQHYPVEIRRPSKAKQKSVTTKNKSFFIFQTETSTPTVGSESNWQKNKMEERKAAGQFWIRALIWNLHSNREWDRESWRETKSWWKDQRGTVNLLKGFIALACLVPASVLLSSYPVTFTKHLNISLK